MKCSGCKLAEKLHKTQDENENAIYKANKSYVDSLIHNDCKQFPLYKCSEKGDCAAKIHGLSNGMYCENAFDLHDALCLTGELEGREY